MEARPGLSAGWLICGRDDITSIDLRIGGSVGRGGGGSRLLGGDVLLELVGRFSWRAGSEGRRSSEASGGSGDGRPDRGSGRLGSFTESDHVDVLGGGAPGSLLFANFILSVQFGSELADDGSTGDSKLS